MPDLLESIIQPPGLVKDELRQKLFKIDQFGSKIKKIRVCTFQMSGKIWDSTNVAFEAPLFAIFGPATPSWIKNLNLEPWPRDGSHIHRVSQVKLFWLTVSAKSTQ